MTAPFPAPLLGCVTSWGGQAGWSGPWLEGQRPSSALTCPCLLPCEDGHLVWGESHLRVPLGLRRVSLLQGCLLPCSPQGPGGLRWERADGLGVPRGVGSVCGQGT